MWRGSVTAPPCAAPHHPTCTGTGYAPYPVGDLLVGPFQTPYRPITGRCGQALMDIELLRASNKGLHVYSFVA